MQILKMTIFVSLNKRGTNEASSTFMNTSNELTRFSLKIPSETYKE